MHQYFSFSNAQLDVTLACTALFMLLQLCRLFDWSYAEKTAILIGAVFLAWSIPLVNWLAEYMNYWHFDPDVCSVFSMPLGAYLLWVICWSFLPVYFLRGNSIAKVCLIFLAVDIITLPLFGSYCSLADTWFIGEAMCLGLCLLPLCLFTRWCNNNSHLALRLCFHFSSFVFSCIIFPVAIIHHYQAINYQELTQLQWSLGIHCVLLAGLPGISAFFEFFQRGRGTPLPWDPPRSFVVSGVYRYVKNPMQISTLLMHITAAVFFMHLFFLYAAITTVCYSVFVSRVQEHSHLSWRFKQQWQDYAISVRSWLPHWKPYTHNTHTAHIYFDGACSTCQQSAQFFINRNPRGLQIQDATTCPHAIRRVTYINGEYEAQGIEAIARAMEHINLAYALLASFMRLPIIQYVLQICVDCFGPNPHEVCPLPQDPNNSAPASNK
ncbi:MAG: DUF393 domain-containing protein [Planctomycetes bacterium]|nr:DUF393 domain-containing protein [Planctomycetota bacterium]